ncbi:MAG: O-antigen ligase family protein, partial [Bacteroidota bacterium]
MFQFRKIIWVYILSIIFILVNCYMFYKEIYLFALVPLALLVIMFAVFSLDRLLMLIVFLTPLSIPLKDIIPGLEFDMFIPTEPLLVGTMIIFIFKLFLEKNFDRKIILHPVSIAIYINLIWILITSVTSTMPVVSFKFLLTRMWFIASFYFLAAQLMKKEKNIQTFFWLYIIPLIIVVIYTISRHLQYGLFDKDAANIVMTPFYNDHTSYAAILAMYIPILAGMLLYKGQTLIKKTIILAVFAFFIIAIVLSYTRASWLSLAAAVVVLIIVLLRIKFRYILLAAAVVITLFLVFRTDIMIALERNRQDASLNFAEQIQSISNVSTDASNLERFNRWNCAMRMFYEKPVFGWGP